MGAISKAVEHRGTVIEPSKIEAVPITDANGNTVMLRAEDAALFVHGNVSDVTKGELAAFFIRCSLWKVDPYKDEAYIIKYGSRNPATIVIAEKVLEMRADQQPGYQGMDYGVVYEDAEGVEHKRKGKRINTRAGERIVGAWAEVYRDGRRPTYTEIAFDEYAQYHYDKNSGGQVLNTNWASKPGVMLTKCVKASALREAFPNAFEGMYVEGEVAKAEPVEVESRSEPVEAPPQPSEGTLGQEGQGTSEGGYTDGQQGVMAKVQELAELKGTKAMNVMNGLLRSKSVQASGYPGTGEMTDDQTRVMMRQLDAWIDKAREEGAGK